MKIAATYDNGQVFQHFGRTETFKIYEAVDGKIVSVKLVATEGTGHEALAGFLADLGVTVLVCGGMGSGASAALSEAGIDVYSGVEGNADDAVAAYLRGELVSDGVNCDHHDEEEEGGCGCGCGGDCGGCGGGCGGCGGSGIEGKNVGKTVKVHYKGTLNDGTQFDSSYDRGEPLEFVCGAGMMIHGFDAAVANMGLGEIINIHLMPEDAYGEADPENVFTVPIAQLPGSENLTAGQMVYLYNTMGQPMRAKVVEKTEETITFDVNHEMAGKELNFQIELVEING